MSIKRLALDPGMRFGRWIVLKRDENGPYGQTRYLCECDCGTKRSVLASRLLRGETLSCGCRRAERCHGRPPAHGMSQIPEYRAWQSVIQRCENPNDPSFPSHGGRGIAIWGPWRADFEVFYNDVGPRPSFRHILERRDRDVDWIPGNVRWVLASEARTRRGLRRRHQAELEEPLGEPAGVRTWVWRGKVRLW